EEAAPSGEVGQLLGAEPGVVQPFGADEQDIDLVGREACPHVVPLLCVRRVHRHGAHPGPLGRRDLVAHQGEEGGDDEGRAGPLRPLQPGGDEVDGGLAPPGALDDEDAGAAADEGLDRLELPVAEGDVVATDELAQDAGRLVEEGGARGGGGHAATVGERPDDGPGTASDGDDRGGRCEDVDMASSATSQRFTTEIVLRWGDMDAYGHVNNVQYHRLLEEARVRAFKDWFNSQGPDS